MSALKKFDRDPESLAVAEVPAVASLDGIFSAPVDIAPFGKVLVVNILGSGPKACSYDCLYCDLGRTFTRLSRLKTDIQFPNPETVSLAAIQGLKVIHDSGPSIEGLLVSGNGEPTVHPDFHEVFKALAAARDLWLPGKTIHVHTNGANLDQRKTLDIFNSTPNTNVIVKFDAGNEKTFKLVNSPLSRTTVAKVLRAAEKLKRLTVQSLFFKGSVSNISTADTEEWIEIMAILRPAAVHIQGLSRLPAEPSLIRCEEDELYAIASRLERKTQIKAIVIP
jgi:wyosine [tRNA(Phe)-imidazoG37] synthetase (radical SAM superfamily)